MNSRISGLAMHAARRAAGQVRTAAERSRAAVQWISHSVPLGIAAVRRHPWRFLLVLGTLFAVLGLGRVALKNGGTTGMVSQVAISKAAGGEAGDAAAASGISWEPVLAHRPQSGRYTLIAVFALAGGLIGGLVIADRFVNRGVKARRA